MARFQTLMLGGLSVLNGLSQSCSLMVKLTKFCCAFTENGFRISGTCRFGGDHGCPTCSFCPVFQERFYLIQSSPHPSSIYIYNLTISSSNPTINYQPSSPKPSNCDTDMGDCFDVSRLGPPSLTLHFLSQVKPRRSHGVRTKS